MKSSPKRPNPTPARRPAASDPPPKRAGGRLDPSLASMFQVAREWEGRVESALATVGLSAAKFMALQHLATAHEALTLSDLAEHACCVRSNITQLVDRLEADALVERVDDPHDRRVIRAQLTPLGKERYAAGARIIDHVSGEFAASLPTGDRALLERLLARLH